MLKESVYDRMTNAEREVAVVLKKFGIQWTFEQPVFVWDDQGRPRVWAPDFYLTQFGIYLEVCGSKDFDYDYRKRVLIKNGYCVIFLHVYKESIKWEQYFKNCLKFILMKRINGYRSIFQP